MLAIELSLNYYHRPVSMWELVTQTKMNPTKLTIFLTLAALCSSSFNLRGNAAEPNSHFYRPEIKAALKNGKVLLFPTEQRLGTLQYRDSKDRRGKSVVAIGRVEIPEQVEVTLIPSTYLLQNPAIINRFSGAISGIELKNEESKILLQKLVDKDSIKTLRVSDINLDQKLLLEINSMNKLKTLQFVRTKTNNAIASATSFKCLPQLEWLALDASTTGLIKQLSKSTRLRKLEITNANLTARDFIVLKSLPALQFLSLQQCQYADAAVACFPQMKNLRILWLGKRRWSKQSILPLKQMKMLQELHVQVFDQDLPLLVELHDALPNVEVN